MALFDFLKKKRKKKSPPRPRGEPKISGGGSRESSRVEASDPWRGKPLKRGKKSFAKTLRAMRGRLLRFGFKWGSIVGVIVALWIAFLYVNLPDIATLGEIKRTPSIVVKAEDGKVVGTYGDLYGNYVPYSHLPKNLINAVVATEDRDFFHHFGISPLGLLRATFVNLRAHHVVQGGSTITQQVAKNVFLTPERTFKRKIQEMLLALKLEHRYSKQEILTIYMNRVYMGAGNYGVDSASKRYFGHGVEETTLSENAMLVGLLKAPSRYAPTNNPDLSEKRATQVLLNMKDAGYLNDKQLAEAEQNFGDEDSSYRDNHSFGAFYFSDYVVSQIPQQLLDEKQDLVITTTLKPDWQAAAEDAVNEVMDAKGKAVKAGQAALLSMTPDGAIRAMVGGRNYRASQFNRVTQGLRQPGSSFKLFVYLAGLEAGYTPDSQMIDQPINVGSWHPRDYTGKYLGSITLRYALAESINSIAVQLSETIGRSRTIEMAHRLGITREMEADPSIALGTTEVSLLDMTKAYGAVAANGVRVEPYAITRIDTADGHPLFQREAVAQPTVLADHVVRMMNDMLMAVTTIGTGRGAQIGRPVAGKTGTTSDYKDAWFIGFTPQLVTGVWVGNDDNQSMKKVSGATLPASIWHHYMAEASKGMAVAQIPTESVVNSLFDKVLPMFGGESHPAPVVQNPAPLPNQYAPPTTASQQIQQQIPQTMPAPKGQPMQQMPVPPGAVYTTPPTAQTNTPPTQATQMQEENIPEDQPVPQYNAPSSFWDKLVGDDKKN